MINKLIKYFKVSSLSQLLIVFLVFSITGSLAVIFGKFIILYFFGCVFEYGNAYWILRILIIFPLYQFLLLIVGAIFGEFDYFWEFEKKLLIRMGIMKLPRS